jgi:Leucine Rich repeat
MTHFRPFLIVSILLVANVALHADEFEDRTIAAIEALGGKVSRNGQDPAGPVTKVDLSSTKATDADLKGLATLKKLEWLALSQTMVTDAGLKEVASLQALQILELQGTQVTDAGLKDLAPLKGLRELYLIETKIGDAGLKDLASLQSLRILDLMATRVTDAGLKNLTDLKGLKELLLEETRVTAAGVAEFKKLLPDCKIFGAGAALKMSTTQVKMLSSRVSSYFNGPGGFDGVDWTQFTASGLGEFQETFDKRRPFFTSSDRLKRDDALNESSKCCQSAYGLSAVGKASGNPRTANWTPTEDELGRTAIMLQSDSSRLVVSFAKVDDSLKIVAIEFRKQ